MAVMITPRTPRSDFPDTGVWLPNLRTDFNGEVVVTLTLPDTLTTWRATVFAATADTQVGEATATVTTWQPFIVRPLLPRQLTAGDRVELSTLVHNYSDQAATLDLSLDIQAEGGESLNIMGDVVQTITLPAGGSQIVGWPLESEAAGSLTLTVSAQNEGSTVDAVSLPLEIQPMAVRDLSATTGRFSGRQTETISVAVPADAHPHSFCRNRAQPIGGRHSA